MKSSETIRHALREATAAAHARLDTAMAVLDLARPGDYASFLRIQLHARASIEGWAAAHCPFELEPPPQTPLIAADLSELGETPFPAARTRFSVSPEGALGVAWALGGSSLGNRAMLADLRKRGARLPVRFLADEAMPGFFSRLRRQLEQSVEGYASLPSAITAAHAVFTTFASAVLDAQIKRAA